MDDPKTTMPRLIERKGSALAAGITAAVVLLCVIAAIFLIPDLTNSQRALFRFLIAIGSGAFATFFLGGVAMEGTVGNFRIAAGGGFALFLIMLLVVDPLPPEASSKPAEPVVADQATPDSPSRDDAAASSPEPKGDEADDDLGATVASDFRRKLDAAAKFASENEGVRIVAEPEEIPKLERLLLLQNLRTEAAVIVLYDAIVQVGAKQTEQLAEKTTEAAGAARTPSGEKRWLREFIEQRRRFLKAAMPSAAQATDRRMDRSLDLVNALP